MGWKKGAYTGAVIDNPGYLGRVKDGTLFIDEIDKLSMAAQASLLQIIESRRYRRLGDAAGDLETRARFIVGTNIDLRQAVREGRFRQDLYYRINVLPVTVPPLGERLDELPRWAAFMLARRCREGGQAPAQLAEDAIALLCASPWPGNLRQLDNIITRSYVLSLVEHGPETHVLVEWRHVASALRQETDSDHDAVLSHILSAAQAFARKLERSEPAAREHLYKHSSAFRGLVLAAAIQQCGSSEGAFRLIGQETQVRNRNMAGRSNVSSMRQQS